MLKNIKNTYFLRLDNQYRVRQIALSETLIDCFPAQDTENCSASLSA